MSRTVFVRIEVFGLSVGNIVRSRTILTAYPQFLPHRLKRNSTLVLQILLLQLFFSSIWPVSEPTFLRADLGSVSALADLTGAIADSVLRPSHGTPVKDPSGNPRPATPPGQYQKLAICCDLGGMGSLGMCEVGLSLFGQRTFSSTRVTSFSLRGFVNTALKPWSSYLAITGSLE